MAIWEDGSIKAKCFESMARGQSEALVPMIDTVLKQAGIAPLELDMLAVTTGPGAFTGVRIGLATARGFALATGRPLIGISTFEVLAHSVAPDARAGRSVLCVIDTKRGDVFLQEFDQDLHPVGEAFVATYEEVLVKLANQDADAAFILAGDGAPLVLASKDGPDVDACVVQPDAVVVARIAAGRDVPKVGAMPPGPVYLRPPEAKKSPNGGRLRQQ